MDAFLQHWFGGSLRGMKRDYIRSAIIFAISLAYWFTVNRLSETNEPWDAASYWSVSYPLSMLVTGVAAFLLRRHYWVAGALTTMAQIPVMLLDSGAGPLWLIGFGLLGVLALPAMIVAELSGRMRDRFVTT